MKQKEIRTLATLCRVQAFINAVAEAHPRLAHASVARRRLDNVVAQITTQQAEQSAGTLALRNATQQQYECRDRLFNNYLLPLCRIAASDLEGRYALEQFRLPPRRSSVERLATVARGMAYAAGAHAADFIAAGLPLDFIERLERATDRMVDTIAARASLGTQRSATTAAIRTLLAEARKLVNVIDAFVTAAFHGNPAELAKWNATKRNCSSRARTSAPEPPTIDVQHVRA